MNNSMSKLLDKYLAEPFLYFIVNGFTNKSISDKYGVSEEYMDSISNELLDFKLERDLKFSPWHYYTISEGDRERFTEAVLPLTDAVLCGTLYSVCTTFSEIRKELEQHDLR